MSGDVIAETTNGDVVVANSKASSLEVSTVNGDVRFEGPAADKGAYRMTTHNGDIRVSLGANANATVFVRTFGGDFSSDFPVTLPEGMSNRDGNKRFNFTLGGGSARVELQSFQGDIHVSRGPLPPERQRRRGAAAHFRHDGIGRSPPKSRPRSSAARSRPGVDVEVDIEIDEPAAIEMRRHRRRVASAPAITVDVAAIRAEAAAVAQTVSAR